MNRDDLNEALHTAAESGHAGLCEELIARGANVQSVNTNGWTALHLTSSPEVGRVLLAAGAQINARTKLGNTPLISAMTAQEWVFIRFLLDAGADPQVKNSHGRNLLNLLAMHHLKPGSPTAEYVNLTQRVASLGIDPNQPDQHGDTPLIAAINIANLLACQLLLNMGADPELANDQDESPLQITKKKISLKRPSTVIAPAGTMQRIHQLLESHILKRNLDQIAATPPPALRQGKRL